MQWLTNPSNLPVASVIGISFTTLIMGMGFGTMLGRAAQRRFDDWFHREGPKPWWI